MAELTDWQDRTSNLSFGPFANFVYNFTFTSLVHNVFDLERILFQIVEHLSGGGHVLILSATWRTKLMNPLCIFWCGVV